MCSVYDNCGVCMYVCGVCGCLGLYSVCIRVFGVSVSDVRVYGMHVFME